MKKIKVLLVTAAMAATTMLMTGCGATLTYEVGDNLKNVKINQEITVSDSEFRTAYKYNVSDMATLSGGRIQGGMDWQEAKDTLLKSNDLEKVSGKQDTYASSYTERANYHFITLTEHKAETTIDKLTNSSIIDDYDTLVNRMIYIWGENNLSYEFNPIKINVKFPFKVFKTNGKILSDGYTVQFTFNGSKDLNKRIYAEDKKAATSKNDITISAVNGKTYKTHRNVKISASEAIVSATIRVSNGKNQKGAYTQKLYTNEFNTDEIPADKITSDNLTYKITIKTASGKKKVVKFVVDTTNPTIKVYNKERASGLPCVVTATDESLDYVVWAGQKYPAKNGVASFPISENGKYRFVAYDKSGRSSKKIVVIRDEYTLPKVNVKNKAVYNNSKVVTFSDESGIKKATLIKAKKVGKTIAFYGKGVEKTSIESGTRLTTGYYRLSLFDNCGNNIIVEFEVR